VKKEAGNLADCNSKKADQNGVHDDRAWESPCSERSLDKEAQEMVAALELRIKEEPEDEEVDEEEEEEDRTEGENGIHDSGLHMNGGSYKCKSGGARKKSLYLHILVTGQDWVLVVS
jgi:hypothetical protein